MADRLQIAYIPLSELHAHIWAQNPKKHDQSGLERSISRYGYQSPIKEAGELNKGDEGLLYGNGRVAALWKMKEEGLPAPANITVTEDGEWLVPVVTGNDLGSMAEQISFALDHNALVLAGSGISSRDALKMWDAEQLVTLIETLGNEFETLDLVSIGREELEKALSSNALDQLDGSWDNEPKEPDSLSDTNIAIGGYITIPIPRDDYLRWLDDVRLTSGFSPKEITAHIAKSLMLAPI